MKARSLYVFLPWALVAAAAGAAEGLVAPAPESLWPGWHARISLQIVETSPGSLSQLVDSNGTTRGLQGGALLGDYYLAQPSFGTFRATSGLVIGAQGGAPMLSMAAGSRFGFAVQSGGLRAPISAGTDLPSALPYLGLGFSGSSLLGTGLSISADVGLVGENQGSSGSLGRALLGNQGIESALREFRLSPMLQVGVRYTF